MGQNYEFSIFQQIFHHGVRVRFDPEFLKKEEERKEEKKKLLKMADNRKKELCRQLFDRLTDTSNRADLALQDQFGWVDGPDEHSGK
ncbi:expressed unknown protein [Seminavis robusta]|uniref:Uncharacterized protein n=1 Tax=Seminavis robusta TaxID=568900 RepID=A0A9N8DPJ5_9STRA|nr:expressed unknown protein [Seminavis robusta]|eukprot:Sro199_g084450.1 n/a (87) ;mRNA; f:64450-65055